MQQQLPGTRTRQWNQIIGDVITMSTNDEPSRNPFDSLIEIIRRNNKRKRENFLSRVKKGDILISQGRIIAGMVGHAAIMATDYWVLEMPGGGGTTGSSFSLSSGSSFSSSRSSSSDQEQSLEDNNRRISKHDWYDVHIHDTITIYRCPVNSIAIMAADWAYTHYYNSSGGEAKTIHIRYSLVSPDFSVRDPSYCSKLVLQSYHYGTGTAQVISLLGIVMNSAAVVPTTIPSYFTSRYKLTIIEF